jgi:hypothetical protein
MSPPAAGLTDTEIEALEAHDRKRPLTDAQMDALESALAKQSALKGPSTFRKQVTQAPGPKQSDETVDTTRPSKSMFEAAGQYVDPVLAGASQGTTLGFGDELQGVAEGLASKAKGGSFGDAYREGRDSSRAYNQAQQKASPLLYGGAEFAGAAALPVPGGAGKTLGAKLLRAGVQGGGLGGLMAAGSSDADLTRGEVGEFAKDVAVGTGTGAGVGTALGLVGAGASKLTPLLREYLGGVADRAAVKGAGPDLADMRGVVRKGEGSVEQLGRDMRELGVTSFGASRKDIANRAQAVVDAKGKEIGSLVQKLDDILAGSNSAANATQAGGFNPTRAADRIEKELIEPLRDVPAYDGVVEQLQAQADRFRGMGDKNLPYSKAQKIKQGYDEFLNYDKEQTPLKEQMKRLRGVVGDEILSNAEKLSPEDAAKLRAANRTYGQMSDAADMAAGRLQREATNRYVSPSDYGAGGVAGLISTTAAHAGGHGGLGSMLLGLGGAAAGGAANHLARTHGQQMVSAIVGGLENALAENPNAFGKFSGVLLDAARKGPEALAAAHFVLSKNYPEYAAMTDQRE